MIIQKNETFHKRIIEMDLTRHYHPNTVRYSTTDPETGIVTTDGLTEQERAGMRTIVGDIEHEHVLHLYAGRHEQYVGSMVRAPFSERLINLKEKLHTLDNSKSLTIYKLKVYSEDEPEGIQTDRCKFHTGKCYKVS